MLDLFFNSNTLPFTVALGFMLGIAVLEGVATLLGVGFSSALDSLLPEVDLDADLSTAMKTGSGGFDLAEVSSLGVLSKPLGWLHVGRVPVLILVVLFLLGFGVLGLGIQFAARGALGGFLPGLLAIIFACAGALSFVHLSGRALAAFIPHDETDAVSEQTFIGRVASITLGTASKGKPAQAKLRDPRGHTHYVMVEPDEDDVLFPSGTDVLLVSRAGAVFQAIRNTNKTLVDTTN